MALKMSLQFLSASLDITAFFLINSYFNQLDYLFAVLLLCWADSVSAHILAVFVSTATGNPPFGFETVIVQQKILN